MSSKARMTFRFDEGAVRRMPDAPGPDDDIEALEELIRQTDRSGWNGKRQPAIAEARAQAPAGASGSPVPASSAAGPASDAPSAPSAHADPAAGATEGPEIDPILLGGETGTYASRHSGGPSWSRVFASVAGAVVTGALFGYLVLSLFTGEPLFPGEPAAGAPAAASPASQETEQPPAHASASSSGPASAAAGTFTIPGNAYYLLQYGVFRTGESMETALQDVRTRGWAAAADAGGDYRVYVGVAGTRDEAERLARQLSGAEVFVKPMQSDPLTLSSAEYPAAAEPFFERTGELAGLLIRVTLDGLRDEQPQPLPEERRRELQQAHQAWLLAAREAEGFAREAKEGETAVVRELNAAVRAIDDYVRSPSRYHLWNAQSSVMNALLAERRLREMLRPAS